MEPLRKEYPELLAEPREDNFGIALYSRRGFVTGEVISLISESVPSIAAAQFFFCKFDEFKLRVGVGIPC